MDAALKLSDFAVSFDGTRITFKADDGTVITRRTRPAEYHELVKQYADKSIRENK